MSKIQAEVLVKLKNKICTVKNIDDFQKNRSLTNSISTFTASLCHCIENKEERANSV